LLKELHRKAEHGAYCPCCECCVERFPKISDEELQDWLETPGRGGREKIERAMSKAMPWHFENGWSAAYFLNDEASKYLFHSKQNREEGVRRALGIACKIG